MADDGEEEATATAAHAKELRLAAPIDLSGIVPGEMKLLKPLWFFDGAKSTDAKAGSDGIDGIPPAASAVRLLSQTASTNEQRAFIDLLRDRAVYAYSIGLYTLAAEYCQLAVAYSLPPKPAKVKKAAKKTDEQRAADKAAKAKATAAAASATTSTAPAANADLNPFIRAIPPAARFKIPVEAGQQIRDVYCRALLRCSSANSAAAIAPVAATAAYTLPYTARCVIETLTSALAPVATGGVTSVAGSNSASGGIRAGGGQPRGVAENFRMLSIAYSQLNACASAGTAADTKSPPVVRYDRECAYAAMQAVAVTRGAAVTHWVLLADALFDWQTQSVSASATATATSMPNSSQHAGIARLAWLCYDRAESLVQLTAPPAVLATGTAAVPTAALTGGWLNRADPQARSLPHITARLLSLASSRVDTQSDATPPLAAASIATATAALAAAVARVDTRKRYVSVSPATAREWFGDAENELVGFVLRWFTDPYLLYSLFESATAKKSKSRMTKRGTGDVTASTTDGKSGGPTAGATSKAARTTKRTEDERDAEDADGEYDDDAFDARLL